MFDSVLTITLAGTQDNGTTLTLVHEKLDTLWVVLDQLAGAFAAPVPRGDNGPDAGSRSVRQISSPTVGR